MESYRRDDDHLHPDHQIHASYDPWPWNEETLSEDIGRWKPEWIHFPAVLNIYFDNNS